MTLSRSILLGNQKRNVQKPYKEIRQVKESQTSANSRSGNDL